VVKLRKLTEGIAALFLAAMFVTFVIQIVARYVFNSPLQWSLELCLTLWLWLVLWGNAFCLKDSDHIRFDVLYERVGFKTRRVFDVVAALTIAVVFGIALMPTFEFVSFITIKKSASLKIPLGWIFCIYLVFMGAVFVRSLHRLLTSMRRS
jgi:TRAP-type C4-dicarboxylate transport system permease small subunit